MQPAVEILSVPLAQKENSAFEELLELAVDVWAQQIACVCLGVRGCEGEGLCLCTGEQPALGSLQTGPVCQVLPCPGKASPAAQSRGLYFPSYSESAVAGHKYHLDSCTSAFCVTVRFGFSPCPYSVFECVCCEFTSNISAPQGGRVMVMWGCARKAKNWQASSNIAELTVPRKFRLHPALHSCLSKNQRQRTACCRFGAAL